MNEVAAPPVSPKGFRNLARMLFSWMSWSLPLLVILAVAVIFPATRKSVTAPWNITSDVYPGLMVLVLCTTAWVIWELIYASRPDTTVEELKRDSVVSTLLFGGFCCIGSVLMVAGALPWLIAVPWVGSVIDGIFTSIVAINNAAQKPLIQPVK